MTCDHSRGCRCLLAARILCRDVTGDERRTLVELAATARDIDADGLSGTVEIDVAGMGFRRIRPLIQRGALLRLGRQSRGRIPYMIDVRAIPARRGVATS